MSEGQDFLHWQARRDGPTKVLLVDGEMSERLMARRFRDALRRSGYDDGSLPENFHVYCYGELQQMPPPLNTPAGQEYFERCLINYNRYEFIIFDNIQALLDGDMTEEGPWKLVLPWTHSLTSRGIGQLWVDHTGYNTKRAYGSSTKGWQMDTSILLKEVDRPWADIAFEVQYLKARERSPENRADFSPVVITLERDRWFAEKIEEGKPKDIAPRPKPKPPSKLGEKFYNALSDALCMPAAKPRPQSGKWVSVIQEEWIGELLRLQLIDPIPDDADKNERRSARNRQLALVAKYRSELLAANWIACSEGVIWIPK
jgi:hypothetical protein